MASKRAVIIVAGGKGTRFGSTTPKQFLPLGNQTVIERTINKFVQAFPAIELVIVLPKEHFKEGKNQLQHQYEDIYFVVGGNERYHSVKNGLQAISPTVEVVGIHDVVRPMLSIELIRTAFDTAETLGTAIPTIPITSSLRKKKGKSSTIVDRTQFLEVQTPQCFQRQIIETSYLKPYTETFTDDASVVESAGYPIHLIEGHKQNIKITTPQDLTYAAWLLEQEKQSSKEEREGH